jgi:hypothetical protein
MRMSEALLPLLFAPGPGADCGGTGGAAAVDTGSIVVEVGGVGMAAAGGADDGWSSVAATAAELLPIAGGVGLDASRPGAPLSDDAAAGSPMAGISKGGGVDAFAGALLSDTV